MSTLGADWPSAGARREFRPGRLSEAIHFVPFVSDHLNSSLQPQQAPMATTVQQVPAQDGQLRRLEPAAQVAARAGQLGEQAVQELCRRAPESLKPSLEAAVQRASPIVAKATDSGKLGRARRGRGRVQWAGTRRSPRW